MKNIGIITVNIYTGGLLTKKKIRRTSGKKMKKKKKNRPYIGQVLNSNVVGKKVSSRKNTSLKHIAKTNYNTPISGCPTIFKNSLVFSRFSWVNSSKIP